MGRRSGGYGLGGYRVGLFIGASGMVFWLLVFEEESPLIVGVSVLALLFVVFSALLVRFVLHRS